MKVNLVYLVYGRESEFHRALLSIASFFAWIETDRSNVRLLIYTDQPAFFEKYLSAFDPYCYFLDANVLEQMLGGASYIHRRKVKTVEETFKMYPNDAVVFVDADTFFIKNPGKLISSLSPKISLMHTREFTFLNGQSLFASFGQPDEASAFIEFIEKTPLEISGELIQFSGMDYCWNSGLIGLHPSMFAFLPDILKATDQIHKNSSWFISEQIAFSLVLGVKSRIIEGKSVLTHYWDKRQKAFVDDLLSAESSSFKGFNAIAMRHFIQGLSLKIHQHILVSDLAHFLSGKQYKSFVKTLVKSIIKNPSNILLIPRVIKPKINNHG